MLRSKRSLLFCLGLCALCFTPIIRAQITNVTNSTSTPTPGAGHDYIKMLSETVDPANGSLSLRMGVPIPTGRRLTIPFSFAYDSNGVWVASSTATAATWGSFGYGYITANGWSYLLPLAAVPQVETRTVRVCGAPNDCRSIPCNYYTNFTFGDPYGGRHNLGLFTSTVPTLGDSNCKGLSFQEVLTNSDPTLQASIASGVANDRSTLRIADAHGTTYSFAGTTAKGLATQVEDRNGNIVNLQDSGSGVISITDTLGRTAISTSGFGVSGNTVSVAGLANPFQLTWGMASYNFNTTWTQFGSSSLITCLSPAAAQGSGGVVSVIAVPNASQYQFTYEPTYGLLSEIVYPTGGYVSYAWGENPQSAGGIFPDANRDPQACSWRYGKPAILHRYVSFDGVHLALQQDFQYTTTWSSDPNTPTHWTSKQTVVTTRDLVRGTSFITTYLYTTSVSGEPQPEHVNIPVLPPDLEVPVEQAITYQDVSGTTIRTVNKTWANAQTLLSVQTTLDTGQTSKETYNYGPGLQLTEKDEYDFGQTSPSRKTIINYQAFPNTPIFPSGPSIFDKPCQTIVKDSGGSRFAETDYFYDNGSTTTVCGTPGTPSVAGVAYLTGEDDTNYNGTAPRGNVTSVIHKCFPSCADALTTYAYDEGGQVLSMTDPNDNTTQYSYADNYTAGTGTPPGSTDAYLTKITRPTTNGVAHVESFSYAYSDGQLTTSTDENGQQTKYFYNDSLRRLTETDFPDCQGGVCGKTTVSYNDTAPSPSVTTSKLMSAGQSITSVGVMDGLGHIKQTQLTSDPQGTDFTDTAYDGLGRVYTVSNPYRTTGINATGTTTYAYDTLGRSTQVTLQDGFVTHTSYSGNTATVTDSADKSRESVSDALGRLTQIVEDPDALGYVTNYTYDALDNLTNVVQNGSRQRTFAYDSLSRLTSATNPESGSITYTYDNNGNVHAKTDARGIATTSSYDALNRLTGKSYSNGDPSVSYTYDQSNCLGQPACFNIGHRTSMTDTPGTEAWSYDTMGRPLTDQRTASGVTKSTSHAYNLYGSIKTLAYPGGRVVNYAYDSAGHALSAIDSTGAQYVSNATYWPNGAPYQRWSPVIYLRATPNNRLQTDNLYADNGKVTAYYFFDTYNYGSQNNGNILSITKKDATRTQDFTYDALNRVASAQTQTSGVTIPNANCWGLTFGYDAWGNLLSSTSSGPAGCGEPLPLSVAATTSNQVSGYCYDAAGNLLDPGACPTGSIPHAYAYNAENQLVSTAGVTYTYDGDGKRISKSNGKLYWYGMGSDTLDETDASGNLTEYVFFNGKRMARIDMPSGAVHYYLSDHLGSTSMVVSAAGTIEDDSDFYPFGGERPITSSSGNTYKFTGKERDSESGLDNFGARYDSSSLGRFMSPDPIGGQKVDPQTLNKYSYVRNNPINFTDPTGLYTCKDDNNKCQTKKDIAFEKSRQQDLKSKDKDVVRAANAYGDPTKDNHVSVGFADLDKKGEGGVTTSTLGADDKGNLYAQSDVTINSKLSGTALDAAVGHEGSHVADAQDVVSSIAITEGGKNFQVGQDITRYQSEQRAYAVTDSILKSGNENWHFACGFEDCILGTGLQLLALRSDVIGRLMAGSPLYRSNGQPLSPTNQGGSVVNGLVVPH